MAVALKSVNTGNKNGPSSAHPNSPDCWLSKPKAPQSIRYEIILNAGVRGFVMLLQLLCRKDRIDPAMESHWRPIPHRWHSSRRSDGVRFVKLSSV